MPWKKWKRARRKSQHFKEEGRIQTQTRGDKTTKQMSKDCQLPDTADQETMLMAMQNTSITANCKDIDGRNAGGEFKTRHHAKMPKVKHIDPEYTIWIKQARIAMSPM
jgi:hypothetical protein